MTREEFLRQEIERYRKKIETYQAMVAEWESELGIQGAAGRGPEPTMPAVSDSPTGDPLSVIGGMVFYRKSQPEAAKAFLEMVKYPLTTEQIVRGIEKGGVKVGGKTAPKKKQNLYTILNRSPEFERVARDTWGLKGWASPSPKKPAQERIETPENPEDGDSEEVKG